MHFRPLIILLFSGAALGCASPAMAALVTEIEYLPRNFTPTAAKELPPPNVTPVAAKELPPPDVTPVAAREVLYADAGVSIEQPGRLPEHLLTPGWAYATPSAVPAVIAPPHVDTPVAHTMSDLNPALY